jgi:hypothetical protein
LKNKRFLIFATEAALFALILWQIVSLTGIKSGGDMRAAARTSADIIAAATAPDAPPAPHDPLPRGAVAKSLAEKEAQRIVETGDVESLQQRIDENAPVLRLLGYDL